MRRVFFIEEQHMRIAKRDAPTYVDASGGVGNDGYTCCVAHKEKDQYVIDPISRASELALAAR
jgi:hypothetical protein